MIHRLVLLNSKAAVIDLGNMSKENADAVFAVDRINGALYPA